MKTKTISEDAINVYSLDFRLSNNAEREKIARYLL